MTQAVVVVRVDTVNQQACLLLLERLIRSLLEVAAQDHLVAAQKVVKAPTLFSLQQLQQEVVEEVQDQALLGRRVVLVGALGQMSLLLAALEMRVVFHHQKETQGHQQQVARDQVAAAVLVR
jgi:hypothetical protein